MDFFAVFTSGAQRLPNGNTLVCSGPENIVFEVTAEKQVVWKFWYPNRVRAKPGTPQEEGTLPGGMFRSYRYPSDHPGLVGRDLKPGKTMEELGDEGWSASDRNPAGARGAVTGERGLRNRPSHLPPPAVHDSI